MRELYFETPLYKKTVIEENENQKIKSLIEFYHFDGLIDGYNPELNENTSYRVKHIDGRNKYREIYNYCGIRKVVLECVRSNFEITYFFQLVEIEEINEDGSDKESYVFQKVGQIPTIADLEIGKYKKFSKVISKEHLRELNKAIGLATNGVGVGSFVYLRRIFETLIENYHQIALNSENWKEDEYRKSKIADKIGLLKDYLPEIVVKYKKYTQ